MKNQLAFEQMVKEIAMGVADQPKFPRHKISIKPGPKMPRGAAELTLHVRMYPDQLEKLEKLKKVLAPNLDVPITELVRWCIDHCHLPVAK